jgi:hypothetical protein
VATAQLVRRAPHLGRFLGNLVLGTAFEVGAAALAVVALDDSDGTRREGAGSSSPPSSPSSASSSSDGACVRS